MRDKVVCYKGIGGRTPADSARSARRRVDQGWQFLRLSVVDRDGILRAAHSRARQRSSLAAVREEVGPEIEIVIDYHTRLDPPDAIKLWRELELSTTRFSSKIHCAAKIHRFTGKFVSTSPLRWPSANTMQPSGNSAR